VHEYEIANQSTSIQAGALLSMSFQPEFQSTDYFFAKRDVCPRFDFDSDAANSERQRGPTRALE